MCPCYEQLVAQDDREQAIEAITRAARESRARHSRTFWIAALAVGALGVAAFIVILLVDKGSTSRASAPSHESGFATGLALGIAVGIALGFAIARRQSSRPHSDRSIP